MADPPRDGGTPVVPTTLTELIRMGWAGFNHWRRRYWLTRVLILLVLFALPIWEYVTERKFIVELVKVAIESIQCSSDQQLVGWMTRFYLGQELNQIQRLVRNGIDANDNEVIEENEYPAASRLGLTSQDLTTWVLEIDAAVLIDAARNLGMVDETLDYAMVRRSARQRAVGFAEEVLGPDRRKIQSILDACNARPNLLKWQTWEDALREFPGYLYLLADSNWGLEYQVPWWFWFSICVLAGCAISAEYGNSHVLSGSLTGIFLGLASLWHSINESLLHRFQWTSVSDWWADGYFSLGWLILCGVASGYGSTWRIGSWDRHLRNAAILLLAAVLVLLLAILGVSRRPLYSYADHTQVPFFVRAGYGALAFAIVLVVTSAFSLNWLLMKMRQVRAKGQVDFDNQLDLGKVTQGQAFRALLILLVAQAALYGVYVGGTNFRSIGLQQIVVFLGFMPCACSIALAFEHIGGGWPLGGATRIYVFLFAPIGLLETGHLVVGQGLPPVLHFLFPFASLVLLVLDRKSLLALRIAIVVHSVLWIGTRICIP